MATSEMMAALIFFLIIYFLVWQRISKLLASLLTICLGLAMMFYTGLGAIWGGMVMLAGIAMTTYIILKPSTAS